MRFSRFWCIRSFKATWKTSSSFKESLNASVGSEPKIYVEIHGPCIYTCFLFIGIVRNCDQLEVTCLTCFFVVIPERSRGGTSNGTKSGIFVRQERRRGYRPRSESSMCQNRQSIRQGRWLVAHQLKLPAVDGWTISLIISSKIIPSLKLRRCPWKLQVGTWNFLLGGNIGLFSGTISVSRRLHLTKCLMFLFKVHPGYEGTMFQ